MIVRKWAFLFAAIVGLVGWPCAWAEESADETADLQERIDAAFRAGGGTVRVIRGNHFVTSVRLRSNVTLYLEAGARLVGNRDPESYRNVFANDCVEPPPAEWMGTDETWHSRKLNSRWESAVIRMFQAENVSIIGEEGSEIDLRDCADPKGEELYRGPHGITAVNCTNLVLKGYLVRNAGNYAHRLRGIEGVTIRGVKVRGGHDGIDVHMSTHVRISGCDIRSGDDCIAGFGDVDVIIRDCYFNSACSPLRFGGTDVLIENCRAVGPAEYPHRWTLTREEKLASVDGPSSNGRRNMGCFLQHGATEDRLPKPPSNIVFRNVQIENATRFFVTLTGQGKIWSSGASVPVYVFENVRATGLEKPSAICVSDDSPMKIVTRNCLFAFKEPVENAFVTYNVTFDNEGLEVRNVTGDFQRKCATKDEVVVPEFPSWRIEKPGTLDVLFDVTYDKKAEGLKIRTTMSASAGAFSVPERHRPQVIMGRDYWPALYRYGDWAAFHSWASPARLVRFDNPSITNMPAFRDVVPIFYARNPPPPAEGVRGVWQKFAENFLPDEPDREILTSNPHPDRPFILWATGKRSLVSYAGAQDLDAEDYRAWKSAHPNHMFDGVCDEWDIDHDYAWINAAAIKDPNRRKAVQDWLGEKPRNRYERADKLRRFFENRRRACYGGDMYVCISHVLSSHLAADCGAKYLNLQTTSTCEKDEFGYRWNVSGMFARGAVRQFGIKWEWYHAGYMNGWTHDGQWWDNAVTVYPESEQAPEHYTSTGSIWPWHCGPEFGTSANALERMLYFAWLSGPNFSELEEWSAQYLQWDKTRKRTELTGRGRDYVRFYDFAVSHQRGVAYTPVAICVPVAQGYPAWGGYSSAMPEYGYTAGDRAIDAVFFTIVPGYDRIAELHRGREYSLFNSPFANMYDVIAPDAPSQSDGEKLSVFKSYKALVVVGDYPDRSFEKVLAEYERQGGRVIRLSADTIPLSPFPTTKRAIEETVSGREKFPAVEKIFSGLQSDYFPFRVTGDLLYGVNKAEDGWILYAFNNKGVIKFADTPHVIDHAFDTEVSVMSSLVGIRSARELTRNERQLVENGSFRFSLPAGEFRIFEIR